jgi:hypothetical protein
MTGPRIEPEPDGTPVDDVDDVIGIAAEMMREEEGRLDQADLHAVGEELDIPPEYIERARVELRRRREQQSKDLAERTATRKKLALGAMATTGVVALVTGLLYASTAADLRERYADVQSRAAQVENVRARKAAIVQQLAGRPPSPDKDAELVGAENRIRVESKRYAEAATSYNQASGGWFAGWAASVAGLPEHVPVTLP